MGHLLDALKTWMEHAVGTGGYPWIFLLMLLESACIPIPSEVTMPVAGLLAQAGKISLAGAILVGTLGNLAGSLVAYWVGRSGGRGLLLKYGRFVFIKPHDIERADLWFERYGGKAVFFSRLLPVVRTFISLPAGVAEMPIVRFTLMTFLGCLPWSAALTYAGYVLGQNWKRILPYSDVVTYAILGIVVLGIAWWLIKNRTKGAPGTS